MRSTCGTIWSDRDQYETVKETQEVGAYFEENREERRELGQCLQDLFHITP